MKKIIIIDDEINIRMLLEQTLEELEDDNLLEILPSASDGEMGLNSIIKHNPDIIIMDIMMPKLNGFQVYEIMKEKNISQDSKMIMISAKSQTTDVEKAQQLDIECYITKPFDPDYILDKVRSLV